MINKITAGSISTPCCVNHWTVAGNHSTVHWDVAMELTYIKSTDMLNKNTLGAKRKRDQVGSTSYFLFIHLNKMCDIWWRPRPKLFAS